MKLPLLPMLGGVALVIVSFIGGCAYKTYTKDANIEVKCSGIKGGRECFVNVKDKPIPDARICWEMHSVCENGNKVMAQKCVRSSLSPGTEVRALLANQEFSNYEKCDKITASAIESLHAIEGFTRFEFPLK